MAKRSGYRIRLEWFVPFDPENIEGIQLPNTHMDAAKEFLHLTVLKSGGMLANIQTKYQARREVPDEPKAAEAQGAVQVRDTVGTENITPATIPAFLDATKRAQK